MSGAFTPGPWCLDDGPHTFGILTVRSSAKSTVTVLQYDPNWRPELVEMAEANARLIAAAPELYEALESILADQDCTEGDKCPHWVAFHKIARDALAKARGQ